MSNHTCLQCNKEVSEEDIHNTNSIRNSGYCCECFDLCFLANPLVHKEKQKTLAEKVGLNALWATPCASYVSVRWFCTYYICYKK